MLILLMLLRLPTWDYSLTWASAAVLDQGTLLTTNILKHYLNFLNNYYKSLIFGESFPFIKVLKMLD